MNESTISVAAMMGIAALSDDSYSTSLRCPHCGGQVRIKVDDADTPLKWTDELKEQFAEARRQGWV